MTTTRKRTWRETKTPSRLLQSLSPRLLHSPNSLLFPFCNTGQLNILNRCVLIQRERKKNSLQLYKLSRAFSPSLSLFFTPLSLPPQPPTISLPNPPPPRQQVDKRATPLKSHPRGPLPPLRGEQKPLVADRRGPRGERLGRRAAAGDDAQRRRPRRRRELGPERRGHHPQRHGVRGSREGAGSDVDPDALGVERGPRALRPLSYNLS